MRSSWYGHLTNELIKWKFIVFVLHMSPEQRTPVFQDHVWLGSHRHYKQRYNVIQSRLNGVYTRVDTHTHTPG